MSLKDRLNHRPGRLNRILTGKECPLSGHGVFKEPFVGCFLA